MYAHKESINVASISNKVKSYKNQPRRGGEAERNKGNFEVQAIVDCGLITTREKNRGTRGAFVRLTLLFTLTQRRCA